VLGFKLSGRLTTVSANGTYSLQIKNYDLLGGLGTLMNQGENVSSQDFSTIANNIDVPGVYNYWRDFDNNGVVSSADFSQIVQHTTHDCDTPNNP